jgi:S1-C subfamily serine protease
MGSIGMRVIVPLLGSALMLLSCAAPPAARVETVRVQLEGPLELLEVRERAGAVLGRANARAFLREVKLEGPFVSLVIEGDLSDDVKRELALIGRGGAGLGTPPDPSAAPPPVLTIAPATTPVASAQASPTAPPPVEDAVSLAAARRILPAVVHLRTGTMPNGTGFIVSADGLVLTNAHVARGMGPESVAYLYDGRRVPASVVGLVEGGEPDIAVVRIAASGLTPVEFADAASLRPGDPLLVIGHPQGYGAWLVTGGKLLALEQVAQHSSPTRHFTQLRADVAGAPGNSGSPFVDMSGRVVGLLWGSLPVRPSGEARPTPFERIIWDWDEFLARAPRGSAGVSSEDARRIMREIVDARGNVP